MLDFNNAPSFRENKNDNFDAKTELLSRIESVIHYLLPNAIKNATDYRVGSVEGEAGNSLSIAHTGDAAGQWVDHATGDCGDIVELWAIKHGIDCKSDYPKLLENIKGWCGTPVANTQPPPPKKAQPLMPQQSWDYLDIHGNKIITVTRLIDENGKKTYRPFNHLARSIGLPKENRPLYNLIGIHNKPNDTIIIVEGEKCAQALIDQGYVATTICSGGNMGAASKTDWRAIENRNVLIWADNDEAGKKYADSLYHFLIDKTNSIGLVALPDGIGDKWDAYDAIQDGWDIGKILSQSNDAPLPFNAINIFDLGNDDTKVPDDIIEPRILTPSGMLVIAGAPKVGKSDFVLHLLTAAASGGDFLGMKTPYGQRRKIFYLQLELEHPYLVERIKKMDIDYDTLQSMKDNLFITARLKDKDGKALHIRLDDEGAQLIKQVISATFTNQPPDIIVIDPIRNIFFGGGKDGNDERSNEAMMLFLERVVSMRDSINPLAGVILVHHTRKISKREMAENPFSAISGASALEGYMTSGIVLYKESEVKDRIITISHSMRYGYQPNKYVTRENKNWRMMTTDEAQAAMDDKKGTNRVTMNWVQYGRLKGKF